MVEIILREACWVSTQFPVCFFFLIWPSFHSSCQKDDQSSQQNYPEDLVTPPHKRLGSSCILQPKAALGLITCRPSSTSKLSRKFSSSSSGSSRFFPSRGRHNLLARLRRRQRQQSRVNFDSQEDVTSNVARSSDRVSAIRSRKCFLSPHLSVVSCYRSSIVYDPPRGSLNLSHAKEIQGFSKKPSNYDTQKRISFSGPDRGVKYFPNLETKAVSPGHWTVERTSHSQSLTASPFSLPTVMSSSSQVTLSIADGREHGQLNKDSEDALHHRSQSTNYSPGDTKRLSQNRASSSLSHDELPSLYKDVNSLIVQVTSGPFEEGFATSPPDEETASPIEMTEIRSPRFSFL